MRKKLSLKFLLYFDVMLLLIFIFYKSYLYFFEADFQAKNISSIQKLEKVNKEDGISFAVVGNINNSIDIFDKKIVKKLNKDKSLDFVVSTGDSVLNGSEDKYRVLNRDLNKVDAPTILCAGTNEITNNGTLRFYKHYGPLYFSYNVGDAFFIFLDTTGETPESYQRDWLVKELKGADSYKYKFVFMNKPPYKIEYLSNGHNNNIKDEEYATFLKDTFSKYNVTSVFCSSTPILDKRKINNVQYFVSGGAGGSLLVNNKNSYYHYIKVNIKDDKVDYSIVKQNIPSNLPSFRVVENCWFFLHSFFYINFFTFILVLSILIFIAIVIKYKAANVDNYYTDFDELPEELQKKESLNIAMFTNNYVPFIGGVPISIVRLTKGLRNRGHNVIIFAPDYPEKVPNEPNFIIRLKLLIFLRTKPFDFPIVNIFSPKIEEEFLSHDFDIVHVHHPFWMGKKGLYLGRKHGIPVILTYHTRLEKYAHNLPAFHKLFEGIVSHHMTKKFSQKCNAVFAPTSSAKEYLANIGVSRHKVVLPTGVDVDFYNSVNQCEIEKFHKEYRTNNEIILCSVSRLTEEKNIYFLLKGIKYIKEHSKVPFKCIIIGDGPEKENIINTIEKYKLNDFIELVGSVSPEKVCYYYKASDIFVFSSQSETQGMVILEAMAGSCPVVAIRSSGIDDVLKNSYNGFKTKADVALWGDKVIYLMENPEELKQMSENAFNFSNKFSLDSMAEVTEGVYYEAIRLTKGRLKKTTFSETFKINLQKKGS